MIEQQGQAVRESPGRITVRLGGTSGCARCDAGRGCGAGLFGKLLRRKAIELEFDNHVGARRGQAVVVGVPEALYLGLTVKFYLFPLIAGLAGAVLGHWLATVFEAGAAGGDALTLLAALAAGAAALRANRNSRMEFLSETTVHLLRVADSPEFAEH
jgi:sigma-E factor negative regulatory protein RseC